MHLGQHSTPGRGSPFSSLQMRNLGPVGYERLAQGLVASQWQAAMWAKVRAGPVLFLPPYKLRAGGNLRVRNGS